jgi:steroid delta-isomerase-like uncharacterized protein
MSAQTQPPSTQSSERYGPLLLRHLEAENARQLEETLATLTPDCVFEDMALAQQYHGLRGAGEYYRTWWDAFEIVVHGERLHWTEEGAAVAEARYQGRHIGEFLGVPATGRPIDLPICVFISFKDGLMAGERFYYDLATLRQQLGLGSVPEALPYIRGSQEAAPE